MRAFHISPPPYAFILVVLGEIEAFFYYTEGKQIKLLSELRRMEKEKKIEPDIIKV